MSEQNNMSSEWDSLCPELQDWASLWKYVSIAKKDQGGLILELILRNNTWLGYQNKQFNPMITSQNIRLEFPYHVEELFTYHQTPSQQVKITSFQLEGETPQCVKPKILMEQFARLDYENKSW